MHAGTVVTKHWFRHEGRGFTETVLRRCTQRICKSEFRPLFGHGVETGRDFVLTRGSRFVVVSFNQQLAISSMIIHAGRTDVLSQPAEPGSNRLSRARAVALCYHLRIWWRVPCAFDIVDSNVGTGNGAPKRISSNRKNSGSGEQNGVCEPVERRYSSARLAMERGSRS